LQTAFKKSQFSQKTIGLCLVHKSSIFFVKFFFKFFFVIFQHVPLKWIQNHYSGMRIKSPISILSKLIRWSNGYFFVEKKINIFFSQKNKKFQYKVTFWLFFAIFMTILTIIEEKKNCTQFQISDHCCGGGGAWGKGEIRMSFVLLSVMILKLEIFSFWKGRDELGVRER
jgi:hypothetical protein